jgi:ketosteroid isomerase-like protein
MASTKEVLDHHLKCFGEGDLKGILSDYAPGAVLFTPDGPLRGAEAMRPLFQALIAEFGKPGAVFSMKRQSVEGEYAYILWTAETADNVYEVGDGHIRRAERQDRDAVIHRQDYAQRLETRPLFLVGYLTREAITAMSSR